MKIASKIGVERVLGEIRMAFIHLRTTYQVSYKPQTAPADYCRTVRADEVKKAYLEHLQEM